MAIGKYRSKHTWYDSRKWGTHEELLAEGVSAGRGWALVRQWRPFPRYSWQRGESYILRVDISEFFGAWSKSLSASSFLYEVFRRMKGGTGVVKAVCLENRSPGWWENGFSQQLCLESKLFAYSSEADKFEKVVKSGMDWDTVDYDKAVADLCRDAQPLFDFFIDTAGTPGQPYTDDF